MTYSLPSPGASDVWGAQLNNWLRVAHNADGSRYENVSDTATVYVTADGSDSNAGVSWGNAVATVSHALTLLPAHGGIIEVGYGSFAGFTITSQAGVTVRGRGLGRSKSITDNSVSTATHPTMFTSAITLQQQSPWTEVMWAPCVMQDFGVVGVTGVVTNQTTTNSGDTVQVVGTCTAGTALQIVEAALFTTSAYPGQAVLATQGCFSGTGTGTFTVSSATGIPTASSNWQIEQEVFTATSSGTTVTVTARGANGTSAATHANGSTTTVVSPTGTGGQSTVHLS